MMRRVGEMSSKRKIGGSEVRGEEDGLELGAGSIVDRE